MMLNKLFTDNTGPIVISVDGKVSLIFLPFDRGSHCTYYAVCTQSDHIRNTNHSPVTMCRVMRPVYRD